MRKALYILGELDDRDIGWLARNGATRTLAKGEQLITAGREVRDLYFVTEGELVVSTPGGSRLSTMAIGDVVGEMSFVEKRLPSASVTAIAASQVLAVPREALLAVFEQDPGFAARFYRALAIFLSDRLRSATTEGAAGDELDEGLLDTLQQAGDRFVRLMNLLGGREH
ncbi:cyclic nucleotide-binding domain-containing protein [uncultured Phenylobacterium sp.]|uniref:cyclic nucleotide-binding domain-containing protein n=1 Tax=uncultured Phenylobacterium sp. TaxID=349273 RepID=UPI0025EBDBB8|nr:cyclic nucleotide-binding domain-containing protein [uncultured Phenylobacterium sp.]